MTISKKMSAAPIAGKVACNLLRQGHWFCFMQRAGYGGDLTVVCGQAKCLLDANRALLV